MSQTPAFIARLTNDLKFGSGERAQLGALAGRGLDESVGGFDLFTGLWWPLRQRSAAAPRREIAWLITKLYAAFPVQHDPCERDGPSVLAVILGREERRLPVGPARQRVRQRFDLLLSATLAELEPRLRWALAVVRDAVIARRSTGVDWVQLTDHLSIWDRGEKHRLGQDIQDIWAEQYWKASK
jgi:CRISPR type I-E-associated protein CasB/Cse2